MKDDVVLEQQIHTTLLKASADGNDNIAHVLRFYLSFQQNGYNHQISKILNFPDVIENCKQLNKSGRYYKLVILLHCRLSKQILIQV